MRLYAQIPRRKGRIRRRRRTERRRKRRRRRRKQQQRTTTTTKVKTKLTKQCQYNLNNINTKNAQSGYFSNRLSYSSVYHINTRLSGIKRNERTELEQTSADKRRSNFRTSLRSARGRQVGNVMDSSREVPVDFTSIVSRPPQSWRPFCRLHAHQVIGLSVVCMSTK